MNKINKIFRTVWIAAMLIVVAGGMTSCEKEPVCNCTKSVYMMQDWQCTLRVDYDCELYRIEFYQNACSDALDGIEATGSFKYKLDCGNNDITIKL